MRQETILSHDRIYRYQLWRDWAMDSFLPSTKRGYVNFIGLNPSTADENEDDRTVVKCRGFAWRWGYAAMCMTNVFAFRCTWPEEMMKAPEPVGRENDAAILEVAREAAIIVACWTKHSRHLDREKHVLKLLHDNGLRPMALKLNKDGTPHHPLYLCYSLRPNQTLLSK